MRVLLILLGMLAHFYLSAQITKGNWLAGGSITFQSEKYSEGGERATRASAMPGAGYFFHDRIAAGVRTSFSYYRQDGDSYRDWSIGPFARYYFLSTLQKTNLFFEGSFMGGNEKYQGFDAEGKTQLAFGAGPAFFINEHIAIETTLGWRSVKYSEDPGRYNSFGIAIGIQAHIGSGKKKNRVKS